jgi:hypothetical protein
VRCSTWGAAAILFFTLFLLTPNHSVAGCKSDCEDNYQSAKDDCMQIHDEPDDADDLRICIDDAHSEYEDCIEECES